MNDYVGLPDGCEILKVYVGGIRMAELRKFADLTEAAMTYFNRLHGWVDIWRFLEVLWTDLSVNPIRFADKNEIKPQNRKKNQKTAKI